MSAKRLLLAGLSLPFMLAGCLVVPAHRGGVVTVAPPLPPIVVLDAQPYYTHQGYHYYYRNDGWYYSHSRRGPWVDLPKEHYPREVQFKDGGPGHGKGRSPGHSGR